MIQLRLITLIFWNKRDGQAWLSNRSKRRQIGGGGGTRRTPCYNIAIGNEEGEVEFTEMNVDAFSGIDAAKYYKNDLSAVTTYKIRQRTLANILKEREIKHVDFVSIDVEGYEMNVLEGINFEEVDITCFCIENNRDGETMPDMELRKFMLKKGYRLVARLLIDDIFVKESYFQ